MSHDFANVKLFTRQYTRDQMEVDMRSILRVVHYKPLMLALLWRLSRLP